MSGGCRVLASLGWLGVELERMTASGASIADRCGTSRESAPSALDERPQGHLETSYTQGRPFLHIVESANGSFVPAE
jgi:hypothetical protein